MEKIKLVKEKTILYGEKIKNMIFASLAKIKNNFNLKIAVSFSLIELMIALVAFSCVLSAFAPVMTKNMKVKNIGFGFGVGTGVSTDCSRFSENCIFCTKVACV